MKRDRGEYRPLYEVLLDGPDWQKLSPDARLVFVALKLKCGALGIKVVPGLVESLTQWTGLSPRRCGDACKELAAADWVQRDGNIVWIVRGLEFEPTMDASNPNHRKFFARSLDALPSLPVVQRFRARYAQWVPDGMGDGMPMGSPTPLVITSPSTSPSPNTSINQPPVAAFLDLVPPQQRTAWESTIAGWREGIGYVGGKRADERDIAQGLTEYLASNLDPTFAPKHVVGYVRKAEERRTKTPKADKPTSFYEVA